MTTHLEKKPGEIAGDLGISKKELFKWLKEVDGIPEEKKEAFSTYFNLDTDEFYDPVHFDVSYGFLSDFSNKLQSTLKNTSATEDYSELAEAVNDLSQELIALLIDGQVQLNLKRN